MAATIAFTLPISCQICLGRVKEPVVCSNQHVFCKTCIALWLEKNHQCPTCRISISTENPCKPVLGGLNPEAGPERGENFSNRELRRARMELIYKDYENEIGRLEAEVEFEKHRADELTKQVRGRVAEVTVSTEPRSTWDYNATFILGNKVRDLTSFSDSLKAEMAKIKKELADNKEENSLLLRENQRMRLDLANRSPRRFGRFTVAALETKLAASERELQQLKKALENSDLHIEELEKQLERRCHDTRKTEHSETAGKSIKLVSEGSPSEILNNSEQSANLSTISSIDIPMELVNIGTTEADEKPSFLLEVPSTDTTLSEQSILEISHSNGDLDEMKQCLKLSAAVSFKTELASPSVSDVTSAHSKWQTDKESIGKSASASRSSTRREELQATSSGQTVDSCTKRLRFAGPDDHFANPVRKSLFGGPTPTASASEKIGDTTNTRPSSTAQFYGSRITAPSSRYGQIVDIQSSSVKPEVEDCLRLMDAIERKVKERTSESVGVYHNSSEVFARNGLCAESASTSSVSHASEGETNGMTSHELRIQRPFFFSDSPKD